MVYLLASLPESFSDHQAHWSQNATVPDMETVIEWLTHENDWQVKAVMERR